MSDQEHQLQQALLEAYNNRIPLWIQGGGSHRELSPPSIATPLELGMHSGVLNYHPQELVITVRSGTQLSEINQLLHQQNQTLAFDPPRLSEKSTMGGQLQPHSRDLGAPGPGLYETICWGSRC